MGACRGDDAGNATEVYEQALIRSLAGRERTEDGPLAAGNPEADSKE